MAEVSEYASHNWVKKIHKMTREEILTTLPSFHLAKKLPGETIDFFHEKHEYTIRLLLFFREAAFGRPEKDRLCLLRLVCLIVVYLGLPIYRTETTQILIPFPD